MTKPKFNTGRHRPQGVVKDANVSPICQIVMQDVVGTLGAERHDAISPVRPVFVAPRDRIPGITRL